MRFSPTEDSLVILNARLMEFYRKALSRSDKSIIDDLICQKAEPYKD